MITIDTREPVTPPDRRAVGELAERAAAHDGVYPLNEEARLALSAQTGRPEKTGRFQWGQHLFARDGTDLAGYAFLSDGSAQLVVDPARRRQGVGTALLDRITALDPETGLWSFSDLGCARGFAAARGYEPVRTLLTMEVRLGTGRENPTPPNPPNSVTIRTFTPDDLDDLVKLNALAFRDHPEQGRLTRADFAARMDSGWFDPGGLFLAHNEQGDLVGFHWTKLDAGDAEVYVLGVHPGWSGRGLGRYLLDAGLDSLAARGATTVRLWVEGDNRPARTLYERSGFLVVSTDLGYRKLSFSESRPAAGTII